MRALGIVIFAACGSHIAPAEHVADPPEGISIALYEAGMISYGVVDDRRTIEIENGTLLLDRIEPEAQLPTLVIEPLGGDPLRVGACGRERIDRSPAGLAALAEIRGERPRRLIVIEDGIHDDRRGFHHENAGTLPAVTPAPGVLSPLVRCTVTGGAGRHRVRVLYVTPTLSYHTRHEVTMTAADRATVSTRFGIETPAWRTSASVTLFDGIPGGRQPPRELARGTITLDGGTSVIALPDRDVSARLRRIYDGVVLDRGEAVKPSDITWGKDSRTAVWVFLELDGLMLSPGASHVHVEIAGEPPRDVEVPSAGRERIGDVMRLPLWVDHELFGMRRRTLDFANGVALTDRVQLAVASSSSAPRDVWIEERLRPARGRQIRRPIGIAPTIVGDVARVKLVIRPGATERSSFNVDYNF